MSTIHNNTSASGIPLNTHSFLEGERREGVGRKGEGRDGVGRKRWEGGGWEEGRGEVGDWEEERGEGGGNGGWDGGRGEGLREADQFECTGNEVTYMTVHVPV